MIPYSHYPNVVVKPGVMLELTEGGDYFFRSLHFDSGSALRISTSEPVRIFVDNGLYLKGTVTSVAIGNLLFAVRGSQTIHVEANLVGTVIAPNAKIEVMPNKEVTGQLLGKRVEFHQDSVFTFAPFAYEWNAEE